MAFITRHAGQALGVHCLKLMNIEDLKQGDFVVHDEHGIGRYEGLTKMTIDRSVNDFLIIVYRDEDKLYLPVERMNLVQKIYGFRGHLTGAR